MERVKCIFFDIGYTLVNEDRVWVERCREQAETDEARALGVSAEDLTRDLQTGSELLMSPWKYVKGKYGFTQVAKYKSELETLYADARPVLEELYKRFMLGIIANQSDGLSARLRAWGIDKCFSSVISSADYEFAKPDKRLFFAALYKNDLRPDRAVMVGDRLDNDILPAKALGFKTVRVKQGLAKNQVAPSAEYEPDFEVNGLTELLALPIFN